METLNIILKHPLNRLEELSLIYTPGVGASSKKIAENKNFVDSLTNRLNSVCVIIDCKDTPESYLPYSQAVAGIIKTITNLDAYPLVNYNYDINKVIENLEPSFAAFYVFSDNEVKDFDFPVIKNQINDYNFDLIFKNSMVILRSLKSKFTENIIMEKDDFTLQALRLRQNLKGVIRTENIYKNFNLDELKEKLSKENLEELRLKIKDNPDLARSLTSKKDTIGIISDGSAVLGLGNIGAYAAMPVMEGKSAIFKAQANINAIPICLKTQNIQEIIDISTAISYSFGGINLEDINAPRCFEIEKQLSENTNIPIFHDDQHGTAIIVLAALMGALKLADKTIENVKIVMSGAGAAAQAVAKLLLHAGAKNLILSDINGVISKNSKHDDIYLKDLATKTNPDLEDGTLEDVLKDADVLIGLSAANIVSQDMIKSMNKKAIVFVLANPTPEIMPDLAQKAGAFIVATGRSDFENQINNALVFPGIFKGLLEKNINTVTDDIKYNAALAIQKYANKNLSIHNILPKALDKGIVDEIAKSV